MEPHVKMFMSGSPISVDATESALGALDLMVDHGIRHLPVVDRSRCVVGVLTFDDLRAAFPQSISLRKPPPQSDRFEMRDVSVGEVMTYAPVTATADTPLDQAAGMLAERRIGCLPILDEQGRLEGIITEVDMLQALATLLWAQRKNHASQETHSAVTLVDTLRSERDHILMQLGKYEEHEQEITERRRGGGLDLVEQGAEVTEAEFTEELAELAARRLQSLDHAIERAEDGKFGHCESCSGRIPAARLRALPGATLCIRCARRSETPS